VAALLGDTPMLADLEQLADEIGGRPTGSEANLKAIAWGLERFASMGIPARKEGFPMPELWLERSASAVVEGDGVRFTARIAAMPFSRTGPGNTTRAPLADGGRGTDADFARLGAGAKGAFVLISTEELLDVDGLFREYEATAGIEARAFAAGVAGVVYMGSRPYNSLHRHNVNIGPANTRPMMIMERDAASRALRLLQRGKHLALAATIDLQQGPAFESYNVVGEIRGRTKPEEIVVLGAHIDSWDLGQGVLDNGANVALVLDVARQMKRLGMAPERTIRFVLWNGEEQEMIGSWGYAKTHEAELDRHVMTTTMDIGCGRITGFFTNGRSELLAPVGATLVPVAGLGPFTQLDVPIVGTDNFDFMMHGVPNLVANQAPASYGPNYHARSDEFARCDATDLRINAAIAAAVTWGFANGPAPAGRASRASVEQLVSSTDLEKQMKMFDLWNSWRSGARGRVK
jgi:hypothetical protein